MENILLNIELKEKQENGHTQGTLLHLNTKIESQQILFLSGSLDKASAKVATGRVPILLDHTRETLSTVGKVSALSVIGDVVLIDFAYANTDRAKQAKMLVDDGIVTGLSAGVGIIEYKEQKLDGVWYWVVSEADLKEVSITPLPADPNARILTRLAELADKDKEFIARESIEKQVSRDELDLRHKELEIKLKLQRLNNE